MLLLRIAGAQLQNGFRRRTQRQPALHRDTAVAIQRPAAVTGAAGELHIGLQRGAADVGAVGRQAAIAAPRHVQRRLRERHGAQVHTDQPGSSKSQAGRTAADRQGR